MRTISTRPDLVEQVHGLMIDAIETGEFVPGERLTQEEIADRFGVSRQPVLQAVALLRQQGLLYTGANRRGLMVAPLDEEFLINLYEVRGALDGIAAAAAARNNEAWPRAKAAELIKRGREAVSHSDLTRIVRTDWEFHRFIYQAANNDILLASASQHWHHTKRAMSACLAGGVPARSIWTEHQQILNAIVKGDAVKAERLARKHADHSLHILLDRFETTHYDPAP